MYRNMHLLCTHIPHKSTSYVTAWCGNHEVNARLVCMCMVCTCACVCMHVCVCVCMCVCACVCVCVCVHTMHMSSACNNVCVCMSQLNTSLLYIVESNLQIMDTSKWDDWAILSFADELGGNKGISNTYIIESIYNNWCFEKSYAER